MRIQYSTSGTRNVNLFTKKKNFNTSSLTQIVCFAMLFLHQTNPKVEISVTRTEIKSSGELKKEKNWRKTRSFSNRIYFSLELKKILFLDDILCNNTMIVVRRLRLGEFKKTFASYLTLTTTRSCMDTKNFAREVSLAWKLWSLNCRQFTAFRVNFLLQIAATGRNATFDMRFALETQDFGVKFRAKRNRRDSLEIFGKSFLTSLILLHFVIQELVWLKNIAFLGSFLVSWRSETSFGSRATFFTREPWMWVESRWNSSKIFIVDIF